MPDDFSMRDFYRGLMWGFESLKIGMRDLSPWRFCNFNMTTFFVDFLQEVHLRKAYVRFF
ncbi:hypothetical protein A6B38_00130 [Bartonella bacilliformis]|nr:hypothetical protein AWH67_00310 [Bartonella bacilliformis]KZN22117.1 hypothetical protein A6B38_00130 [Bartonella bacilliformis]